VREGSNPDPLENGDEEAVILIREASFFVILHGKGFNNPVSSDRLMEEGGDGPHPLLALVAEFPESPAKLCDGDEGNGKDKEAKDGQFPVAVENDTGQTEDGEDILQETRDDVGHGGLNQIDIVGNSGDEDPRGRLREERQREILKVVVQFLPEVCHDSQADEVHQVGLSVIENAFDEEKKDDGDGKKKELLRIFVDKDIIDSGFRQVGLACGQQRNENHADHRQKQLFPIRLHQEKEPAIKGDGFFRG